MINAICAGMTAACGIAAIAAIIYCARNRAWLLIPWWALLLLLEVAWFIFLVRR